MQSRYRVFFHISKVFCMFFCSQYIPSPSSTWLPVFCFVILLSSSRILYKWNPTLSNFVSGFFQLEWCFHLYFSIYQIFLLLLMTWPYHNLFICSSVVVVFPRFYTINFLFIKWMPRTSILGQHRVTETRFILLPEINKPRKNRHIYKQSIFRILDVE